MLEEHNKWKAEQLKKKEMEIEREEGRINRNNVEEERVQMERIREVD